MTTQAQAPVQTPAATRTINVLHYKSKDGELHADPYTRFSELTKRQSQLLKEGIEGDRPSGPGHDRDQGQHRHRRISRRSAMVVPRGPRGPFLMIPYHRSES